MSCEAHQISSAIYDARIILFPHLFFIAKILNRFSKRASPVPSAWRGPAVWTPGLDDRRCKTVPHVSEGGEKVWQGEDGRIKLPIEHIEGTAVSHLCSPQPS